MNDGGCTDARVVDAPGDAQVEWASALYAGQHEDQSLSQASCVPAPLNVRQPPAAQRTYKPSKGRLRSPPGPCSVTDKRNGLRWATHFLVAYRQTALRTFDWPREP